MPTLTPQGFVSRWKRAEARERQSVREHFIDLCMLVGHETPIQADPTGKRYAFEMGAARTSGGAGWADVAKLGYFGWEYKGKHADLDLGRIVSHARNIATSYRFLQYTLEAIFVLYFPKRLLVLSYVNGESEKSWQIQNS